MLASYILSCISSLILFLFVLSKMTYISPVTRSKRLIGGFHIDITDYPYLVIVQVLYKHGDLNYSVTSSGTLIALNWVLTSSSSMDYLDGVPDGKGDNTKDRKYYVCSWDRKWSHLRHVESIHNHPGHGSNISDLTLLKLEKGYDEGMKIKTIKLAPSTRFVEKCRVAKVFGTGVHNSSQLPLTYPKFSRVSKIQCNMNSTSNDTVFCMQLETPRKTDFCYIDVGAPVICKNTLIGVARNDCSSAHPITNVAYYLSWIHEVSGIPLQALSKKDNASSYYNDSDRSTTKTSSIRKITQAIGPRAGTPKEVHLTASTAATWLPGLWTIQVLLIMIHRNV